MVVEFSSSLDLRGLFCFLKLRFFLQFHLTILGYLIIQIGSGLSFLTFLLFFLSVYLLFVPFLILFKLLIELMTQDLEFVSLASSFLSQIVFSLLVAEYEQQI
jgi:hypothetical protein